MTRNSSVRVSIGIPFYNSRATFADAVRSVFAQTYQNWELLLCNDGSSDGTLDIARSIKDDRVRILNDGCNRGLVYRLNELVDASRGEYIVRMDDDDIMDPERIQRQVDYLDANPDVHLVGSSVYTLTMDNHVSGIRRHDRSSLNVRAILAGSPFIHPSITGRREWFQQNRYDAAYVRAEDHELWARTVGTSKFHILEEPLLFYREGRSRTIRKYLLSGRSSRRIISKYGPDSVGRFHTARLKLISAAKSVAYCVLWTCHLEDIALRYSRDELDPSTRAVAQAQLDSVLESGVPGRPSALVKHQFVGP